VGLLTNTSDMGHGTWDMGHGTWDMGHGTWDIPTFDSQMSQVSPMYHLAGFSDILARSRRPPS
jgi:hypothetical protein